MLLIFCHTRPIRRRLKILIEQIDLNLTDLICVTNFRLNRLTAKPQQDRVQTNVVNKNSHRYYIFRDKSQLLKSNFKYILNNRLLSWNNRNIIILFYGYQVVREYHRELLYGFASEALPYIPNLWTANFPTSKYIQNTCVCVWQY